MFDWPNAEKILCTHYSLNNPVINPLLNYFSTESIPICIEKAEADRILTRDLGFGEDCIPGTKDDPQDAVEPALILDAVEARCNSWPNDLNFDGADYEAQTAFCKQ